MRQIISASRRTDIPAFYADWFIDRVRQGECLVPNPYNPKQISKVSLKSEDVIAFVFWTREPHPLMKYLKELDGEGFKYYFLYTITGYPSSIELYSPKRNVAVDHFKKLSDLIGREKVIWRYDPLIFSNQTTLEWHEENFGRLVSDLSGYTERVMLSVIEPYRKTVSRLEKETPPEFRLDET